MLAYSFILILKHFEQVDVPFVFYSAMQCFSEKCFLVGPNISISY